VKAIGLNSLHLVFKVDVWGELSEIYDTTTVIYHNDNAVLLGSKPDLVH